MELRHLRYFLAVAEELHFGRAAKRLSVSQPPLSKQIHQIEEELGVRLFNRSSRKVELTSAGHLLAGEVRLILQQMDRLADLVRESHHEERSHLLVGYSPGNVHIIVTVLRIFEKRFPNVHIQVKNMETLRQVDALNSGDIDVGLLTLRLPVNSEGLVIETILQDRFIVAMPEHHALSRRRVIPLRALADETLILDPLHKNKGRYGLVAEMCRRAGFSLPRVHEVENPYHALELVGAGFGLSLMRASVQKIDAGGVVFRELQDSPTLKTAVAYRAKRASDLSLSFADVAKDAVRHVISRIPKSTRKRLT